MIYDLEKAYNLKIKTEKQLERLFEVVEKKREKYRYMGLPEWIEIEGRSINIGDGIRIYDRVLSSRQKKRPTWGYVLPKYQVMHISFSLDVEELPWALKVLKYMCGSFVIQKPKDDPDYINAINELFGEVSDINKAVKELRKL